jgi:hypothetical protein
VETSGSAGQPEIEVFLTDAATHRNVSAKTQNQAFSAMLFLDQQALGMESSFTPTAIRWVGG